MHVALVTASMARAVDEDMGPLVAALQRAGAEVAVLEWDDADVDWSIADVTVVRSTWDYSLRRDEFLAWARRAGASTRLVNPHDVLEWNTDKRYLAELAAWGVAVVPTSFFAPGDEIDLGDLGELVVKPTVSAGSRDTARYSAERHDAAIDHAARLLGQGREVMVQPYQSSVDERGETAMICFGGEHSHAISKGPLLPLDGEATLASFAEEHITPCAPSEHEIALADAVLAALHAVGPPGVGPAGLCYARVDVVRGGDDSAMVLEVELCEPAMFLDTAPGSADRFATAILAQADL
jgi:hypothetical protein